MFGEIRADELSPGDVIHVENGFEHVVANVIDRPAEEFVEVLVEHPPWSRYTLVLPFDKPVPVRLGRAA